MKDNGSKPVPPTQKMHVFTNSAGKSFPIRGMSPMLLTRLQSTLRAEFTSKGKSLDVPTYEVTTAAGDHEIHEHDDTTLTTDVDKAVWQAYQTNVSEFNGALNTRLMKVVLMAVDTVPTQAWRDEMKFLGMELPPPNSPAERYEYIETEVIREPDDLGNLVVSVFSLAGLVPEAALADVEAAFRGSIRSAYAEAGIKGAAEK